MSPPAAVNMEETKPLIAAANSWSTVGSEIEAIETRFSDFCKV